MGCDIHLVTQVQQADGSWQCVAPDRPCFCVTTEMLTTAISGGQCPYCRSTGSLGNEILEGYWLFSVLGNVRNHRELPLVSEPRGIPEGFALVDETVSIEGREVWLGKHSYSWLLLSELEAYDWAGLRDGKNGLEFDPCECDFYQGFMPALARLSESSERVRIVFGFDN